MRRELKAIFLLFFTVQFGFAQVTFKAAVSKTALGMNERLRVDFTIDKQGYLCGWKLHIMSNE